MTRIISLLCLTSLLALTAGGRQPEMDQDAADGQPIPDEARSVASLIEAMYSTISGEKNVERDWDKYRSFFHENARFVFMKPQGLAVVVGVDDYIKNENQYIQKAGYLETELGARIDEFGRIAHVLSATELRRSAADPEPYSRGLNSIQLVRSNGRWWIMSLTWQAEMPDSPLPVELLNRDRTEAPSDGGA